MDFSIVIPSYGKPESLAGLLESLASLSYSRSRFEVIVVDDGSSIPVSQSVTAFWDRLTLRIFRQRNRGPASARNHGVEMATGRYLAFTDDDCRVHPGWLQALAAALETADRVICGGKTVNGLTGNIYSEASQLITDYLSTHYSPINNLGGFFPSNNLAVSRNEFLKTGGFDPSLRFGEDRDFCYRSAVLGFSFVHVPDALVFHCHHQDFGSFMDLHRNYGRGTYFFRRGCGKKRLPRAPFSPPSWYLNLIRAGIRKCRTPRGVMLSLLLFASQAATFAGVLSGMLPGKKPEPAASERTDI